MQALACAGNSSCLLPLSGSRGTWSLSGSAPQLLLTLPLACWAKTGVGRHIHGLEGGTQTVKGSLWQHGVVEDRERKNPI